MNISQVVSTTTRPYSSLLREIDILGTLFSSKQLTFNMEPQTQSNWCWAATATSVSHFYWVLSTWTQCLVANAELSLNSCCGSPVPSPCNVPWYLDRALTRTNNFVSITAPVSFQRIRDEIDAGRPVGARIGWTGGGGHFMVIYGYSSVGGTDYFDIDDPIYGKSHITVATFSNNYQGSGVWTHTYFTKSFIKMPIKLHIPREAVLRRIWEVRPLLSLKEDLSFTKKASDQNRDLETASLGMAQQVYTLGLDSLLSEEPVTQPINLRVYEMAGGKPRAFFDVSDTVEPEVLQMSTSGNHFAAFEHALTKILSDAKQNERDAELRLFRIPALNFEALWVHGNDRADVIVPITGLGPIPQYEVTPFDQALDVLREAARPLAEMDGEIGA